MTRWLLLSGLLATTGCIVIGNDASEFAPATGPAGATLMLRRGQSVVGELIAVTDSSVIVLLPTGRVAEGPFTRLPPIRMKGLNQQFNLGGGEVPDAATRERLRLVSRFPQGAWLAWRDAQLARSGQRMPDLLTGPTTVVARP